MFTSEYETPDLSKVKRKFKQRRKKPENDDIAEFLAQGDNDGKPGNDGANTREAVRKRRKEESAQNEAAEESKKQDKYSSALRQARKKNADVFATPGDDYDEIEAAINRQKLFMQSNKRGDDAVEELMQKKTSEEKKEVPKTESEENLFITDAVHFISAVPSVKERKEYKKSVEGSSLTLKDSMDGRASVLNVPLPTESLRHRVPGFSSCVPTSFGLSPVVKPAPKVVVPETEPVAKKEEEAKKPEVSEKKQEIGEAKSESKTETSAETKPAATAEKSAGKAEGMSELLIGKGIGNALKILRERKLLGQILHSGRAKDKTVEGELAKFSKAGMKSGSLELDYRDETGHKMTLKEAFRYQCRLFHGIRPSKRKRERTILKREKERNKLLMDQNKDSKLSQALRKEQQQKNVPYMVLDAKRPVIF